jgi:leader peptidase (prepilin peptidase)/N-methyltransferase
LLAALGFAGAAWLTGWSPLFPAHLWFAALTVILVVTDLDEKLIPNRVLYPGTGAALVLLGLGAVATDRVADLGRGAVVAGVYFGLLLLVALVARGGFGLGDVKLAVVVGLFLGFWGYRVFANGLFLTGLAGGLPALLLILTRRAGRGHEIPYGPAMVFGAWAALALAAAGVV